MEATASDILVLVGSYTEKDIRAFSSFLARRVAGTKLWALGLFFLMPLVWTGNFRQTWPVLTPVALVLIGFTFLLRFVILPNRLYKAAIKLPGIFEPRRITIDAFEVHNRSASGGHTFRLETVKEVVETQDHLFVMVTPKQGIPIPKAWLSTAVSQVQLTDRLLSVRGAEPQR